MKKYILPILLAAIIIALNMMFGSVISWFLSISFIACLFYYAAKLGVENVINKTIAQYRQGDARIEKLITFNSRWRSILNFFLLTIVFTAAVFTVFKTMNPGGKMPWFLNNEYHGLSNTGIAFDKSVTLRPISNDSNLARGSITAGYNGSNATLSFRDFFQPVIAVDNDGGQRMLNNIFAEDITGNFSVGNASSHVDIRYEVVNPNIFKKIFTTAHKHTRYELTITCNDAEILEQYNLAPPFSDRVVVEGPVLKRGMSLFDVLLNGTDFSSQKSETYQVLESILLDVGEAYLLTESGKPGILRFFPTADFFDKGYRLLVNGKPATAQRSNSSSMQSADEKFYIGFNNYRRLLHIGNVSAADYNIKATQTHALFFDYPNTYILKSPGNNQKVGSKNIRFITNDFDRIINDELKEGFFFNTYNLNTTASIDGRIDYYSGKPNTPLSISVADAYSGTTVKKIDNKKFSLSGDDNQSCFLFELRDFSDNGFRLGNTIIFLGIIYVLFFILSVFFPGKKIERIEPVILTVVFALITIRFILYWRVATFPPLENISKYELENTLINFDFPFGNSIPLTLVWVALFTAILILYRAFDGKKWFDKIREMLKIRTGMHIVKLYGLFMLTCFAFSFLNKYLFHIEILVRVFAIIIPVMGYAWFATEANKLFSYQPMSLEGTWSRFMRLVKAYFYYIVNNPVFLITLITLGYFMVVDRGFAILFLLFILLKNILLNFLKKPVTVSEGNFGRLLYRPNHYWIYGILALVTYMAILSFKSLFYFLLIYKLAVGLALLIFFVITVWLLYPSLRKLKMIALAVLAVYGLIIAIPVTRDLLDNKLTDIVKHVQYRASIIHQPISTLLQREEYASFKTRKIIETAENQWFINSYITKKYDNSETINLRPHTRIGVDYPTQTRDVVIARYVISELGDFTMYLLLLLLALPMILYLISYRLQLVPNEQSDTKDTGSYAGVIPLILIFTLGLFVWLTATNRFVFFGQDFPFLSLTSKLSVVLPLLLFGICLAQTPTLQHSFRINLQRNAVKYAFFLALIAVFALTTTQKNVLSSNNFSVVMEDTRKHIDVELNSILSNIQDSLDTKGKKYSYAQLIQALSKSKDYDSLRNKVVKDPYTRSILDNLVTKPSSAFELSNPLFVIYDNGRYNAMYNKNLYLELAPVESRNIWNGNIVEASPVENKANAVVRYNAQHTAVTLPYFINDPQNQIQFALMPAEWFRDPGGNIGVINVGNHPRGRVKVFVYKNASKNMEQQATSFASTLNDEDVATIYPPGKSYTVGFTGGGYRYALNKWVNGAYKIIYPLREKNFWVYNFANAVRNAYSNDSTLTRNVFIGLDYELALDIQNMINAAGAVVSSKNRKYNFSAIAADGDGNIRYMADYVTNRKPIDPNNESAIYELQHKQFFFSNAKNERDQWGNRNLLGLFLGPGSSIKPLTTGLIASQVNAGWENLMMMPVGGDQTMYGGLKLHKAWKNDEHYFGGAFGPVKFLEFSSNYYQSVMLFLGSYTKSDFGKDNQYSLANVLTRNAGGSNAFPQLSFHGAAFLPNIKEGRWPATDKSKSNKSYFGNENSLIANSFERNAGLRTKDKDKNDHVLTTIDRVNFVDSVLYRFAARSSNGGYLWSFPEESYFLQSERAFNERQQNFNLGLKTAALGGFPYRITPYKMLEMYLSMFTQNSNLQLRIVRYPNRMQPWSVDETWKGSGFKSFMAQNVFRGMQEVITGPNGTGHALGGLKGKYPGYFFYAKTGTINEQTSQAKSSRRLIVVVSDRDMTQPENIGVAKLYAFYFAVDNTGNFDWQLVNGIIEKTIASKTFTAYFKYNNG